MNKINKFLPIIIAVVAVVILALGAWWFMSRGQVSLPTVPGREGQVPTEGAPVTGEGGFVGKLKDALTLGQSMKCTWRQDESNFAVSYIKDDKIHTEVTQAGKKAHSIVRDDCSYSWEEGTTQGFKMCFEPEEMEEVEEVEVEEEAVAPEGITTEVPDYEYSCEPAIVSESKFELPAGVNFLSMEDVMGGLGE